jgi:hypothetical protein
MGRYRKLPVEIDAIQYDGENIEEVSTFAGANLLGINTDLTLSVGTLEGPHIASVGDYIIKGIKGEFYPCKPDIFKATYELAGQ